MKQFMLLPLTNMSIKYGLFNNDNPLVVITPIIFLDAGLCNQALNV